MEMKPVTGCHDETTHVLIRVVVWFMNAQIRFCRVSITALVVIESRGSVRPAIIFNTRSDAENYVQRGDKFHRVETPTASEVGNAKSGRNIAAMWLNDQCQRCRSYLETRFSSVTVRNVAPTKRSYREESVSRFGI